MSNQASAILTHSSDDCNILRQQIQTSLQRAETHRNRLKNVERRFGIINICLSAAATFIAGQSAISDNPLIGNWRATTTVASIITLSSTIVGGVQKQLAAPDLLTEASECVAKLKALKVETISPAYKVEPVSEEYSKFSQISPKLIAENSDAWQRSTETVPAGYQLVSREIFNRSSSSLVFAHVI